VTRAVLLALAGWLAVAAVAAGFGWVVSRPAPAHCASFTGAGTVVCASKRPCPHWGCYAQPRPWRASVVP